MGRATRGRDRTEEGASARRLIRGRFEGRRDGDGWVIPEGQDAAEDLHITQGRLGRALPGDSVEAEIAFRTRRGRLEGTVVRVLARSGKRVVGQFTAERTVAVWDEQWAREIVVPSGSSGNARPGDLVEVRVRPPAAPGRPLLGTVQSLFGGSEDPRAELRAVLARFDIREEFPPEALAQADSVPRSVGAGDLAGRQDLRGRPILTMDPADARDHDDAIEAARLPGGGYRIGVHIADVSHHVPPGSPLDREAERRGISVYFPERAVPMLPRALSSGICSLVPGEDRLTRSVTLSIAPDGRLREARCYRSVIRSAARLTYEEGARLLAGADRGVIPEAVRVMGRAAAVLSGARRDRGAVDLDLPEPAVTTDPNGNLLDARYAERNDAHRLVEEFMLLANQAVAERLRTAGAPALHRIHAAPDEVRIGRFEDLLTAFGERLRSPSEPLRPAHCARLLARIESRPEAPFLRRRLLRAMRKAEYSPRGEGHFALALPDYTHFTSPIRRYPDLVVHRALAAALREDPAADPEAASGPASETLAELAAASSAAERRAEAAERTLVKRRIARMLAGRLGEVFAAHIAEIGRFGLEITLDEIPARGAVPLSLLDAGFRFDRRDYALRHRATGRRYRIGGALEAQLVRVDRLRGDLEFAP